MKRIFYATVTLILSLHLISLLKQIHNLYYEMEIYDRMSMIDNISMGIIIILYVIYIRDILHKRKWVF